MLHRIFDLEDQPRAPLSYCEKAAMGSSIIPILTEITDSFPVPPTWARFAFQDIISDKLNMDQNQTTLRIVLVATLLCLAGICCVSIIVFGTPFANHLAERYVDLDEPQGLLLHFNGSIEGADGEEGFGTGLSFAPGKKGGGVLFSGEGTLFYLTENKLANDQGAIEYWLKPAWDGNDGGEQAIFEVGGEWFIRFRIIKDGAYDFCSMVWS